MTNDQRRAAVEAKLIETMDSQ